jgi:uncharacterized membrane protein YphA (DoxX/SURF4 family)
LLRLTLGGTAVLQGLLYLLSVRVPLSILLGSALCASGVAILAGFLTPVAGVLVTFICSGMTFSWLPVPRPNLIDTRLSAFLAAGVAAALVFLGPGAFSVDARLFGRREIVIPPKPPAVLPEA